MGELSQVRTALEDIKKIDNIVDASLVSRGGMFITGGTPRGVHRETFAAMSAIIFGAAETTSAEMKDKLSKVLLELGDQTVMLLGVGPKYLLVITAAKDADAEKVTRESKDIITKVESLL